MLKSISTKELVEELKKREGVKAEYAEPYQDKRQISIPVYWLINNNQDHCRTING